MKKTVKAGAAQNVLQLVAFNYELTAQKLYVFRDYKRIEDWKLFKDSVAIYWLLSRDEDAIKNFFEDAQVLIKHKEDSEKNLVLYGYDWAITKLIEKWIISTQLNKKKASAVLKPKEA